MSERVTGLPEGLGGNAEATGVVGGCDALAALESNRDRGLSSAEAARRLEQVGPNDVPEKRTHPFVRFFRKFWGLSAWMIELIALLSWLLHKYVDLGVALALLFVNAVMSFLQEQRAGVAVAALRSRLQVKARVLRDGTWWEIPARVLVPGDIVRLRSGDFVPADARLLEGRLEADQSALTGESREITKAVDDVVFSGSIVRQGEATAVVVATGVRTYYGRTTQLVQTARPKLHIEEVITRVVKWLFLIVGILVAIALVASYLEGLRIIEILPLSLVLLMSAVPVALPVMFTVSMAIGSIELARRGALVTRLSAAEDAAHMDVLCADKTGTLTKNRLALAGVLPQPGWSEADVIRDGALASNEANQDPIDLAFLRSARERDVLNPGARVLSFVPFSAATRRTEAVLEVDGRTIRAIKGALRTVAELVRLDSSVLAAIETRATQEATKGYRVLAVARGEGNGPIRLVGVALLHDEPRPDSRRLIEELQSLGVTVKMLTGDALPIAREVARELGLGEIIRAPELRAEDAASRSHAGERVGLVSGFAEILPEDKFLVVQDLQAAGHVVGMTGDGVNDAPALRQAEVGIAVDGSTDVAKGAASIVLTTEGLGSIVELVRIGRAVYQRVLTWIINKISRTILKSGLVVIAFLATGRYVISALGMVLLVFMTDFVKISLSTDRVSSSRKPETWNIGHLLALAVLLGVLMVVESMGLLALGWHLFDLGRHDGRLETFTFQVLFFFALFSLVSVRERGPFWTSRPSTTLATAMVLDGCAGIAIGLVGLGELRPLLIRETGLILACATVFCLGLNDVVKTAFIAHYQQTSSARPLDFIPD